MPSFARANVDARLQLLREIPINEMRRVLRAGAPPFTAFRFERVAIRPEARATPLSKLPMPKPLRKLTGAAGRTHLGDLHGLTYWEIAGTHDSGSKGEAMRQLYGLLRIADAIADARPQPLFRVPPQARELRLDEARMPSTLRDALRERGVQKVRQIAALTPARLGRNFGAARWRELEQLLAQLVMLPPRRRGPQPAFAQAIDEAMARLPAARRRALDLRFGAKGRPIIIRDIAARCGIDVVDPHRKLDRWTLALGADAGPPVRRALDVVRTLARRGVLRPTSNDVDAALGITRGPRLRQRDFYLRLLSRLDPELDFEVVWGKDVPRLRAKAP